MLTRTWVVDQRCWHNSFKISEAWKIKFSLSYNNLCIYLYTHIILRNHPISLVFCLCPKLTFLSCGCIEKQINLAWSPCPVSLACSLYFSITCSGNKNSWSATRKQWWHFLIGCFSLTLAWYIDTIAYPIWLLLTLLF